MTRLPQANFRLVSALAANLLAIAQGTPICDSPFIPDGEICEFVSLGSDCQNYFYFEAGHPDRGALLPNACLGVGVQMAVDVTPDSGVAAAGPTGFDDDPIEAPWGALPTGFNIGRIFAAFDDTNNAYRIALDVSAPADMDAAWRTQPVAFDVDGDGSCATQTELGTDEIDELPGDANAPDTYGFVLDTNGDGIDDFGVYVREATGEIPLDAISIDVGDTAQEIDGVTVQRYVQLFDFTGTLNGDSHEWALKFLDANDDDEVDWRDFGVGADIEITITQADQLPGIIDPHRLGIRAWTSSSGLVPIGILSIDEVILEAVFPPSGSGGVCPDDQVCESDSDACTHERCEQGACVSIPVASGDVNGSGGPLDLDDLLCAVAGFTDLAVCPNADLAPDCIGDGIILVDDILMFLNAMEDIDVCGCAQPPGNVPNEHLGSECPKGTTNSGSETCISAGFVHER